MTEQAAGRPQACLEVVEPVSGLMGEIVPPRLNRAGSWTGTSSRSGHQSGIIEKMS